MPRGGCGALCCLAHVDDESNHTKTYFFPPEQACTYIDTQNEDVIAPPACPDVELMQDNYEQVFSNKIKKGGQERRKYILLGIKVRKECGPAIRPCHGGP